MPHSKPKTLEEELLEMDCEPLAEYHLSGPKSKTSSEKAEELAKLGKRLLAEKKPKKSRRCFRFTDPQD